MQDRCSLLGRSLRHVQRATNNLEKTATGRVPLIVETLIYHHPNSAASNLPTQMSKPTKRIRPRADFVCGFAFLAFAFEWVKLAMAIYCCKSIRCIVDCGCSRELRCVARALPLSAPAIAGEGDHWSSRSERMVVEGAPDPSFRCHRKGNHRRRRNLLELPALRRVPRPLHHPSGGPPPPLSRGRMIFAICVRLPNSFAP